MTKPNDEGRQAPRPEDRRLERYVAGVRFVAPIMPATASGAMFLAYLLPAPLGRDAATSVLIGVIAAVIVAVVGGAVAIPSMRDRDRSRTFLELWERYQRLEARLEVAKGADAASRTPEDQATVRLATSDVERIVTRLGDSLGDVRARLASGPDYVGLWQLIHDAEEALLVIEPMTEVIAQALMDRRRLMGSTIPQAQSLLAMQGVAIRGLDPAIAKTYFTAITEPSDGGSGK
jgi:hypothetical protein